MRKFVSGVAALGVAVSGLLLASAGGAVSARAATTAVPAATCSSSPFRSAPTRGVWFRVPAIVRTNAGSLVAFAEHRDRVLGDDGDFDIAATRSTDGGCTWSAYKVIAADAGNRVSNPVPIVDKSTGAILLFSYVSVRAGGGGSGKGLYLQTSTDDGRTFSPLLSRPIRPAGAYKGGLTGVGHGIQLSVKHPGRLVFAMGYKTKTGLYGAYGIYSDDHGATWRTGFDQQDTTGDQDFIEGTLAELAGGDLFISYRLRVDGATAGTARMYAVSGDGGQTLRAPFRMLPLRVVSVAGSALGLAGTHSGKLLFSSPGDTRPLLRRDMSVFVSTTGGATWSKRYMVELESTPGSYSDLVQLNDSTIAVVYETGRDTWKERIAFESIRIPQLTNPTLVSSRVGYERTTRPTLTSERAKVKVIVRVAGITHPPGRVTVAYSGNGRSGAASVDLVYTNLGVRYVTLPRLPAGSYQLTVKYSGNTRIAKASTSAGTLRVVRG